MIVIGGGNTAIDAANAARRLGAEDVHIFYRRSETEMPAFTFEYDHSKLEGVQFHWLAQPVEIIERDGRAVAVKFVETRLSEPDASGRRRPEADPGHRVRARVRHGHPGARAVAPDRPAAGVEHRVQTAIVVDRPTGRTSNPKYYAGGDCVNGGREVVDAVADGKRAARSRSLEEPVADLTTNFAGIRCPNPFWLASGPPANCGEQVMRAFDAGWGGAVWKTIGEPIVNVSSRYSSVDWNGPAHDGAEQHRAHLATGRSTSTCGRSPRSRSAIRITP